MENKNEAAPVRRTRGKDLKPRKRRPSKRGHILTSALKAFSYYGYDGTSLDKIASEASVVKSLVVKYFGTKQDVAVLCVRQFFDEFYKQLELIESKGLPYGEHVKRISKLFEKHRSEWRFLISLWLTPAHEEIAKKIWSDDLQKGMQLMRRFQANAIPEGLGDDFLYTMTALHFCYLLGGNKPVYHSAIATLIQQFSVDVTKP